MTRFIAARQSYLIALGLALGLAAWMYSGMREQPSGGAVAAVADPTEAPRRLLTRVRVRTLEATPVNREVVVHGRTEAARTASLRAEAEGRVVAVGAKRGDRVKKGQVIVRLDPRAREARRAEARALVRQREIQFEAARKLEASSYQSEAQVAEARANLEAARAAVRGVEVEIANTVIRAPFDGILDRRPVEVGEFVSVGQDLARVLEVNPVLVTGDVDQQERGLLALGDVGEARLITGETVRGRIRYVSAESDEATRTFRVEVEVPNPDGAIVAGITAEMTIPTREQLAHHISPALLALDEADRLGVKSVGDTDRVEFHRVEIVRATPEGLWVSGLPRKLRVITVGQGFVRSGDRVEPVEESEVAGADKLSLASAAGRAR